MQIDIYEDEIIGKDYDARLMRRLLKFFKPYQNQLALSLILLVAVSILQLSGPYLTKIAIDDHIVKDDWEGLS
ncbi:MAG: ABC transporter ATP-binding protein, partial [Nitrospinota bacterium]